MVDTLSNEQIEIIGKKMGIDIPFCGYKDFLKFEAIKPDKLYVINLQDSNDGEDGKPAGGSHWVGLIVKKNKQTGEYHPIYMDAFGAPPAEIIKDIIKKQFNKYLNYTSKNLQSMVASTCGFWVLAWAHYVLVYKERTRDIFIDTADFLDMFDDLNYSNDFQRNEYILKHFFQSSDERLRKPIEFMTGSNQELLKDQPVLTTSEFIVK